MKVRCVKIIAPATGSVVTNFPGVSVGSEYHVLEVIIERSRPAKIRILTSDDRTPALFDAAMFVTVDNTIPRSWVIAVHDGGRIDLAPPSWLQVGFWERFFDGDPRARGEFEAELSLLLD